MALYLVLPLVPYVYLSEQQRLQYLLFIMYVIYYVHVCNKNLFNTSELRSTLISQHFHLRTGNFLISMRYECIACQVQTSPTGFFYLKKAKKGDI